jgi:AbrB family looped-hinge helix DNA binding protein
MTEGVSTVTRKGQVTVPIEIRKALDIKQGDRVAFTLEDGHAKLRPQRSYVERTRGILKTDQPPMSAEEMREAAEEAFVDEAVARSGG